LQAERATPYLSTIVASEDLLNTIRLGFISTLIKVLFSQVLPEPDLLTSSTRSCRTLTQVGTSTIA
jgi:hypothetical protein